ncbi:MAG TPA: transcription antitermination factor NusB [Thermoanaerobaculia bacterium]
MNERDRALELLQRIERESLFASLVLIGESGFVRTVVLGVLRWRSRLDFVIETLADRKLKKLDARVVDVLRIGIYQLGWMNVPPHAAVSETVDLAGRYASRARGFVNAIMRRASTSLPEPKDDAARLAHPRWLLDRWSRAFGKERALKIAEANQELSYPDVLVLDGEAPPDSTPSELAPGVARLKGSTADLDRQHFYPMDEGSAVVAAVAATAAEEILDLAAAPGGKSIYMRNRGSRVISNDIAFTRLRPLRARGMPAVVSDGRRPAFRRRFQTVLLDAPCSATGTIRKSPELKWRLAENDLATFAVLQRELLTSAMDLAGETIVYSTCSLEPEENDEVVRAVLASRSEFQQDDIAALVPEGARRWTDNGVLRLTPESGADGFTAFLLRRSR